MTTYGLDVEQRMVQAVWPAGVGQHAATVGAVPASAPTAGWASSAASSSGTGCRGAGRDLAAAAAR